MPTEVRELIPAWSSMPQGYARTVAKHKSPNDPTLGLTELEYSLLPVAPGRLLGIANSPALCLASLAKGLWKVVDKALKPGEVEKVSCKVPSGKLKGQILGRGRAPAEPLSETPRCSFTKHLQQKHLLDSHSSRGDLLRHLKIATKIPESRY